ncbi:MAG TPA: Ku protein [Chthonomonadaceae bacterium]|nr:Ku protein [Chthonomonadaceae bacterium]
MPTTKERPKAERNGTGERRASRARSEKPADAPVKPAEERGAGPRSLWKGAISFGLVTIPIKLFPATGSKDLSFHLLHARCNTRLKQLRWCPACNREVAWDEVVRGYEYAKDQYVRLTDEDFDKLPVASKHSIELSAFAHESEIDPLYYEKSYYLEPEPTGRKSFALLLRALSDKRLTAIGKIALRERERLCALRVHDDSLVLETLYYVDEIRPSHAIGSAAAEIGPRELDMAHKLIDYLTEPFQPEKYRDEYRQAVTELIEHKLHGQEVVRSPEAPQGEVIDLMEALRASLAAETGKRGTAAAPPSRKPGRGAASRSRAHTAA